MANKEMRTPFQDTPSSPCPGCVSGGEPVGDVVAPTGSAAVGGVGLQALVGDMLPLAPCGLGFLSPAAQQVLKAMTEVYGPLPDSRAGRELDLEALAAIVRDVQRDERSGGSPQVMVCNLTGSNEVMVDLPSPLVQLASRQPLFHGPLVAFSKRT